MNKVHKYLYLIFLSFGFIFLRSSYGKFKGGTFVSSLPESLTKFASKNPYPFVKEFLNSTAIPSSGFFGILTMWGELMVGLSLFGISVYLLFGGKGIKLLYSLYAAGLIGGMFLNGVFWLAAGWTSPSTESLNLLMFLVQAVGLLFVSERLLSNK
ncbi:hypothetical protein HY025_00325 [Candidatus Daviesbacteria bacterium]|nr:hypothetical protein [Candidatus Daviesbacteria bacterium]